MIRFKLNELLDARGWSAYRLSRESGIREDIVGTYRNNQRTGAVLAHLSAMCAAMKCDLGDLMENVPDKGTTKKAAPRSKKR
jgi:DNA-binding Xre family transcriptional regulator